MSQTYISEFLFRGRCPENEPDLRQTFHVILCRWTEGLDGKMKPETLGPMTPEQADAMGYPLPFLISTMEAQIMNELNATREALARQDEKVIALTEELSKLKEQGTK